MFERFDMAPMIVGVMESKVTVLTIWINGPLDITQHDFSDSLRVGSVCPEYTAALEKKSSTYASGWTNFDKAFQILSWYTRYLGTVSKMLSYNAYRPPAAQRVHGFRYMTRL